MNKGKGLSKKRKKKKKEGKEKENEEEKKATDPDSRVVKSRTKRVGGSPSISDFRLLEPRSPMGLH